MKHILYILTRTPLHVGAGSSVGAIDQPIIRERHTAFPLIPGSTLKGVFADGFNDLPDVAGKSGRTADGSWLFGMEDAKNACAGSLQFSEAKLLAFPVRSAKGSFAWITSPLILRRFARESGLDLAMLPKSVEDEKALYLKGGLLDLGGRIVLEEYTFSHDTELPTGLGDKLKDILAADPVWSEVSQRLVIISDGMMSFFTQSSCEVAQHVKIDDDKGTAVGGALFNQENVPSETLFYATLNTFAERGKANGEPVRKADQASQVFSEKIKAAGNVFQFGGDSSTGLGFCTVEMRPSSH